MTRTVLALLAAAGLAAQEIGGPIEDVRLHIGVMLSPEAVQRGTLVGGGQGEAEWKGYDSFHPYLGADYVSGAARRGRGASGILWGVGVHVSQMDLTPDRYRIGGVDRAVPGVAKLTWREFGLGGQLGWATRPSDTGFGDWHLECSLVGRGGPLQGRISRTRSLGVQETTGDWGWWYAAGPQVGFILADQGWLVGLTAEYMVGRGSVGFGGGDEVVLTRSAPGIALQIGWRR